MVFIVVVSHFITTAAVPGLDVLTRKGRSGVQDDGRFSRLAAEEPDGVETHTPQSGGTDCFARWWDFSYVAMCTIMGRG